MPKSSILLPKFRAAPMRVLRMIRQSQQRQKNWCPAATSWSPTPCLLVWLLSATSGRITVQYNTALLPSVNITALGKFSGLPTMLITPSCQSHTHKKTAVNTCNTTAKNRTVFQYFFSWCWNNTYCNYQHQHPHTKNPTYSDLFVVKGCTFLVFFFWGWVGDFPQVYVLILTPALPRTCTKNNRL